MRITPRQVGLAAVVLLAPGGFMLGATLVARHYRKRRSIAPDADPAPPEGPIVS